jgi:hypothetical protein
MKTHFNPIIPEIPYLIIQMIILIYKIDIRTLVLFWLQILIPKILQINSSIIKTMKETRLIRNLTNNIKIT